jgi:hypothetical protein
MARAKMCLLAPLTALCSAVSQEMHNTVFAYMHGEDLSQTHIYFSDNGGYSFDSYSPGNQVCSIEWECENKNVHTCLCSQLLGGWGGGIP